MTAPDTVQHPLSVDLVKAGGAKRLNVDRARTAVDEVETLAQSVQEYLDTSPGQLGDDFASILETLGELADNFLAVSQEDFHKIREAMTLIENLLPDPDGLEEIVEAHQDAEEKVSTCEEHKDSERGEYDADTKADARDECQDALNTLAAALDAATVTEVIA